MIFAQGWGPTANILYLDSHIPFPVELFSPDFSVV